MLYAAVTVELAALYGTYRVWDNLNNKQGARGDPRTSLLNVLMVYIAIDSRVSTIYGIALILCCLPCPPPQATEDGCWITTLECLKVRTAMDSLWGCKLSRNIQFPEIFAPPVHILTLP